MRSYQAVLSQGDLEALISSIAGFHDSMSKEIHMVNRGYVRPDHSMVMDHRFDAQVLVQSQWEPFALELLFTGIQKLQIGDPGYYWGASGTVSNCIRGDKYVSMKFDSSLEIVAELLFYRVRKKCLGLRSFLKSEVPSERMVPATVIEGRWRQCTACKDAWEEQTDQEYSYCPTCGELTELLP